MSPLGTSWAWPSRSCAERGGAGAYIFTIFWGGGRSLSSANPVNVAAGGATDARCGERGRKGVTLDKWVMFAYFPSAFSSPFHFSSPSLISGWLWGSLSIKNLIDRIPTIRPWKYCNYKTFYSFSYKNNLRMKNYSWNVSFLELINSYRHCWDLNSGRRGMSPNL
jgi:hypothetical protein